MFNFDSSFCSCSCFYRRLFVDGYAPFLSMTTRESFLTVPDNVVAAPGPGQYDLNSWSKVKGGSTLANKGNRFYNKQDFVPGPGSYNVTNSNEWANTRQNFGFSVKEVIFFET